MDIHTVYEVYTPTTPAQLNFVERSTVNDRLVEAVRTPGRQVVVYGESGSGKSTLVNKVLERLYPDHLVSRCTSSTTYEDLIRDALDQTGEFYDDSIEDKGGARKISAAVNLKVFNSSVERQVGKETSVTSKRVIDPEMTAQRLGKYLGERGLCWIIEDFHKTSDNTRQDLAEALKVFSDLASVFPNLKVIAIGAAASAREVVQANSDMRNRVAEIHVPLMTENEIKGIVGNGAILLNVTFDQAAVEYIGSFSNGLPSIAHYIGLHACLTAGVEVSVDFQVPISMSNTRKAVNRYIEEASDTLRTRFGSAMRVQRGQRIDSPRLILSILAASKLHGLTELEIFDRIRLRYPEYSVSTLRRWLIKLCSTDRGNLLYLSPDHRFRFTEPVMHTFAQGLLGVDVKNDLAISFSEMIASATANWAVDRQFEFTGSDGLTYIIKEPNAAMEVRPE